MSHLEPYCQNRGHEIAGCICNAITFIHHAQNDDGSFGSLSGTASGLSPDSPEAIDFSGARSLSTTFFTAVILHCLCTVRDSAKNILPPAVHRKLGFIIDRGAEFLLRERNVQWSFNYLSTHSRAMPGAPFYPDDLDDTFVALAALERSRPAAISGNALASAVKILISQEAGTGGPYRTWIVPPGTEKISNDPDPVVNANTGYFFALRGVHLPGLDEYLSSCINPEKGISSSPFYPDDSRTAYALSRYYAANPRADSSPRHVLSEFISRMADDILNQERGADSLEISLVISSMKYMGNSQSLRSLSRMLILEINRQGWRPLPFCADPPKNGLRCFGGAAALTAAFAAEALSCSIQSQHNQVSFHNLVRADAQNMCASLPSLLREPTLQCIKCAADPFVTDVFTELQRVLQAVGKPVSDETTRRFARAGLYGWIAFSAYDDVLDQGSKEALPVANLFLSRMFEIYASLKPEEPVTHDDIMALLIKHLDATAAIQIKEIILRKKTVPHRKIQSHIGRESTERGSGYAAEALAMLSFAGFPEGSVEYAGMSSFMKHMLAAKQLHDDAHDWEDDLAHGRITEITTLIEARYHARIAPSIPFPRLFKNQARQKILPHLRSLFWEEIIDDAEARIAAHIGAARQAWKSSGALAKSGFMEHHLSALEQGAMRAVTERDEILAFLAAL